MHETQKLKASKGDYTMANQSKPQRAKDIQNNPKAVVAGSASLMAGRLHQWPADTNAWLAVAENGRQCIKRNMLKGQHMVQRWDRKDTGFGKLKPMTFRRESRVLDEQSNLWLDVPRRNSELEIQMRLTREEESEHEIQTRVIREEKESRLLPALRWGCWHPTSVVDDIHNRLISEWMVSHEEFELSDSDYAVRIDLMTKEFGVDAVERYFEGLPPTAKTSETYTALLHYYAGAKLIENVEDLYEREKEATLSLSAVTYNEIMTLYMSVGQVEKVPSIIEELKRQNVAPDLFTYNLWISSCAATVDIDKVRTILDEMTRNSGSNECWVRYANLPNIYITSGNLMNAESNSLVENEKGITQREWVAYDFLIILYTGLGDKDKVDQIWKSLRMTKQKMTSRNYVCILYSYLILGHSREAGEVIDQWKQSASTEFDISTCNRLLKVFSDAGLMETGKTFRMLLTEKGRDII
ncbi:hypothetical protein ACSBR2_021970 [Camellia fascicularis]